MPQVVITLKIMPKSPEIDLNTIETDAKKKIIDFSQTQEIKTEQEPIAFGLNALIILFAWQEEKELEYLENKLKNIENVNSADVIDIRRAI